MANNISYAFFNCDEFKSVTTMNPLYNAQVYRKRSGRRALWRKIKDEVASGNIVVDDMHKVRRLIMFERPEDANDHITYGIIVPMEEAVA